MRTWALPYLEELGRGKQPFKGDWAEFEKAFTQQFMPQDSQEVACKALKNIKQGKQTVVEYTSKFDQYTMQTGWSDADHHTRYYDGLSNKVKDSMAITDRPIATFEELRKVALVLDQHICQREAEKKGQTFSNMSQRTSSRNPDAMEVDASRQGNTNEKKTHKSYLATMKGRCFGCRLKEHDKKDGNHERDVCHHCGKAGHRSTVCLSKYLGKPPAAKAAATETFPPGPNSNGPSTSSKAAATTSTPAKDSKTQTDLLAQLLEHVKKQDKEIKALKLSF